MRNGLLLPLLAVVSLGAACAPRPTSEKRTSAAPEKDDRVSLSPLGKLPLAFEKNEGQFDDRSIAFVARGASGVMSISRDGAAFAVPGVSDSYVRMKFVGASSGATAEGVDSLPMRTNRLTGNDPSKWHTGIASYAKVKVANLYRGVDVVYYGNQSRLEYDLIVNPGADTSPIALSFDGADALHVDTEGNLAVTVGKRTLDVKLPITYQIRDGKRSDVHARFVVEGQKARIAVGDYDRTLALVVDPLIQYASYLGGTGLDSAAGLDVDEVGNLYITGTTMSTDFPGANGRFSSTNAGARDVFVTKVRADGSGVLWSTYIGGSGEDTGWGLRTNAAGDIYISSTSTSPNFPTAGAAPGSQGCTVTRLSADGTKIVWSHHVGGTLLRVGNNPVTPPVQRCFGLELAPDDGPTLVGQTNTSDFPTTVGALKTAAAGATDTDDGFVTHFNSDGAVVWSTLVGGSKFDSPENLTTFAVDSSGNTFFVGQTQSLDFPVSAEAFQKQNVSNDGYSGFLTKLNSTGSAVVYSTYLGAADTEPTRRTTEPFGVTVDDAGNAIVIGMTSARSYPTKNAFQTTWGGGFITKLDSKGATILWSTFLGGSTFRQPNESDRLIRNFGTAPLGVALDATGNVNVVGITETTDFPIVKGVNSAKGLTDAFIAQISSDGTSLLYSELFGGTDTIPQKGFEYIQGVRATAGRTILRVAGVLSGDDFQTTAGALQPKYAGPAMPDAFLGDGFVMAITPPCDGAYRSGTKAACISRVAPVCPTSGEGAGVCQACTDDKGSTAKYACQLDAFPKCLTPALGGVGTCVECTSDADCNGGICNIATNSCGCDGSYGSGTKHACSDPTTPVCPTGGATPGVCHACNSDFAGGGVYACQTQARPYCVQVEGALDQGSCVLCTKDEHCYGGDCDESIHECRQIPDGGKCAANVECASGTCTNGLCGNGSPEGANEADSGAGGGGGTCVDSDCGGDGCGCVSAPARLSTMEAIGAVAALAVAIGRRRRRR